MAVAADNQVQPRVLLGYPEILLIAHVRQQDGGVALLGEPLIDGLEGRREPESPQQVGVSVGRTAFVQLYGTCHAHLQSLDVEHLVG